MSTVEASQPIRGALAGATGTWTLEPATTTITFQTKAMWGLAKVKGSFKALEGSGTLTGTGAVQGRLAVDASSVATGIKKRDAHLRSADFFESDRYPTVVFTATGATPVGDDHVRLSGTLTVHGQARPIEIDTTVVRTGADSITLKSQFELDRQEWGMAHQNMGAGVLNKMAVSAHFIRS